jgi:hypothetical protein
MCKLDEELIWKTFNFSKSRRYLLSSHFILFYFCGIDGKKHHHTSLSQVLPDVRVAVLDLYALRAGRDSGW